MDGDTISSKLNTEDEKEINAWHDFWTSSFSKKDGFLLLMIISVLLLIFNYLFLMKLASNLPFLIIISIIIPISLGVILFFSCLKYYEYI